MKSVLIWNYRELSNTGGPKGYLYNIHKALRSNNSHNITFLSDLIPPIKEIKASEKPAIKGIIYKILRDIKQIYSLCWGYFHHDRMHMPKDFCIDDYDYVHIHTVFDVYTFRRTFPSYHGRVVLTTHSPCTWTDEMLSHNDKFVALFRPIIIYWECKAYESVDYLMFPCKEAREPYEKDPKVRSIFTQNESKFFYVPSAIMDIKIDTKKMQKLSDLGIPADAFVISYFGRHNSIKGYDILKKVGEVLLDKYPNLYILCAGRIDIEPLNHQRWIELGFINNTHELLYQTDLYISANRETYFDLVVLEILRSSTKLILSYTGGNKYFKNLPSNLQKGLLFFENENYQELIGMVEKCIEKKTKYPDDYKDECVSNRQLYLQKFTLDRYIDNYVKILDTL